MFPNFAPPRTFGRFLIRDVLIRENGAVSVIKVLMERLSSRVPLWFLLLISIIATASIISAAFVIPDLVRSKPDFELGVHPASSVILTANEEYFPVSIRGINNFSGIVSLKVVPPPEGMSASLSLSTGGMSPDAILLGPDQNLTLDVRAFSWGNYSITLIATSGQLFHSTKVFVVVQSVVFSATSDTITLSRGSTATSQIVLSSRNGLVGNVSLSAGISPHPGEINPGLQANVSPSWVILSSSGTVVVILTIQASSTAQNWYAGIGACPVNFPTSTTYNAPMCVGRNFDVIIS